MFRVELTQSLSVNGRRLSSGSEIQLDATTAQEWITEGKAKLVDVDHVGPLFDALSVDKRRPQRVPC